MQERALHQSSLFVQRQRSCEQRLALNVAVAFLVMGIAWVFATDVLLYRLVDDTALIARIETAKGWTFVALGAAALYWVAFRCARQLGRARALISAVVDSIGDGVLVLGADRRIAYANPAAARMLRCAELGGMDAAEFSRKFRVSYTDGSLVPPEQYVSQRVFEEGGPLCYNAVIHPPGAAELVVAVTAAAVRDEVGAPAQHVVSVMHDVTASEHAAQMRDEFFAAAAHALKTPMAIIKTNVQSISGTDIVQLYQSIAAIERQCNRIDRLVQNLLVLARARSNSLELRCTDVDLAPLVERVAREMTAYPQRRVDSVVAATPHARADEDRLCLTLRNLIDLACRAAVPESTVSVKLRQRGDDAEIGISYRAHAEEEISDRREAYDEASINRLVADRIVAAHGWKIAREAGAPNATTWLRMPAAR